MFTETPNTAEKLTKTENHRLVTATRPKVNGQYTNDATAAHFYSDARSPYFNVGFSHSVKIEINGQWNITLYHRSPLALF